MTDSSTVDALVIFGATGDLAKLETFPALVSLVDRGALDVPVVGVAKSGWGLEQFRDYAKASMQHHGIDPGGKAAAKLLSLLHYVDGDLGDEATYQQMGEAMGQAAKPLYYLEVPPSLFGRIAAGISGAGHAAGARVMVEKPFGSDLTSARELNVTMHKYFPEEAIYRVDHWLGLDPVDNMLFTRFANSMLEPLLNRDHVASIQLTMAEDFDVSDRGSFYDQNGAIRDVLQNHLLQVLATVMAEPPAGGGLASWPASKARLLAAIRPLASADIVRGQYDGYLDVAGVRPDSTTETYVGVRLAVDSWRWAGVPVAIRAGKCLPVTGAEVTVTFRRPPADVFGLGALPGNVLRFRVYPESAVELELAAKKPGTGWNPDTEKLSFAQQPSSDQLPYDRLIGAAIEGARWLFAQQDAVEAAWEIVDPVLGDVVPAHSYARGSWGPAQAQALLPDGDRWYDPVIAAR